MVDKRTIENLIADLYINDEYEALIRELKKADRKEVSSTLNSVELTVKKRRGEYGSINVGTDGVIYNRVRNFLMEEREKEKKAS